MRKGKIVVVGPVGPVARGVILMQAEKAGAGVLLWGRDFTVKGDPAGGCVHFAGSRWSIRNLVPGLKGRFQHGNVACALAALEVMSSSGFALSEEDARLGIRSARWPGRFQEIRSSPPIIVDAAHNPAAVRSLVASLDHGSPVVWLFSALAGKDVRGMAVEMMRSGSLFVLVPLDHPRGLSITELEAAVPEGACVKKASSVRLGMKEARRLAGRDGCVVVAGSVVLAGEVLRELEEREEERRRRREGGERGKGKTVIGGP